MHYEITCSAAVANLKQNGAGSRPCLVWIGTDREKVMMFTRSPTVLDELPPEVEEDNHLLVRTIGEPAVAPVATDPPVTDPVETTEETDPPPVEPEPETPAPETPEPEPEASESAPAPPKRKRTTTRKK